LHILSFSPFDSDYKFHCLIGYHDAHFSVVCRRLHALVDVAEVSRVEVECHRFGFACL